jgi:catalase
LDEGARARLIDNLVTHMRQARRELQIRQIGHFRAADADYGRRIAEGLGLRLSEIPAPEGSGVEEEPALAAGAAGAAGH